MGNRRIFVLGLSVLLVFTFSVSAQVTSFSLDEVSETFPYKGFEREIGFWKKVFAEYGSKEVVFHDTKDLRLIFHVETFQKEIKGNSAEARRQRTLLKKRAKEIGVLFDEIRRYGPTSTRLNQKHQEIIVILKEAGYQITPKLLQRLKADLRFQRGVRDKFREGLIRSGRYENKIVETFAAYGLPTELAALPHVESSFDYNAYSKAGAAGIWQFTRGTGRYYLKINRYIDERLDPIRATDAAARLFKDNYAALGSWPLTVTSYNHGRNGMLRAKKRYGDDLRKIADTYKSKYFGFASRNFYAEFLAALEVSRNYEAYFGPLPIKPPLEYEAIRLARAYDSGYLTTVPGLSKEVLMDYNPQLRRILASGRGRVLPSGVEIRVPVGQREAVETVLASAKAASGEVMVAADGSTRYRVQHGDALGSIASQFGTTTRQLQRWNGLSNPNRIYPGQTLLVSQGTGKPSGKVTPAATSPKPNLAEATRDVQVPQTYTVRRGDNLAAIAKRFQMDIADLKRANGISNPNRIYPGQTLVLSQGIGKPMGKVPSPAGSATPKVVEAPGSLQGSQVYTVRRGDNLTSIAKRFQMDIADLKRANGISDPNKIYPGMKLKIPATGSSTTHYVVRPGDTLATIAQRFGSSINKIQNANGIQNPHHIKRGQELLIP
jgi:membrane-bound lytic murein transglycosylase D